MNDYPFRKFAYIVSTRDAEVGHSIEHAGNEDYQHLDLVDCALIKNRGYRAEDNPDVLAEPIATGWLIGDGSLLTAHFADGTARVKQEALVALERWAGDEFTIRLAADV